MRIISKGPQVKPAGHINAASLKKGIRDLSKWPGRNVLQTRPHRRTQATCSHQTQREGDLLHCDVKSNKANFHVLLETNCLCKVCKGDPLHIQLRGVCTVRSAMIGYVPDTKCAPSQHTSGWVKCSARANTLEPAASRDTLLNARRRWQSFGRRTHSCRAGGVHQARSLRESAAGGQKARCQTVGLESIQKTPRF